MGQETYSIEGHNYVVDVPDYDPNPKVDIGGFMEKSISGKESFSTRGTFGYAIRI